MSSKETLKHLEHKTNTMSRRIDNFGVPHTNKGADILNNLTEDFDLLKDAIKTIQSQQAEIERLNSDIQEMVAKAASKHLPAYREQGEKMMRLENEIERLRAKVPEWVSVGERLPEYGRPVRGFHSDWICQDFNIDGVRECFVFGDDEWHSAKWVDGIDEYVTAVGPPEFWLEETLPPAPKDEEGGDT